jgi:nitroimidazol reductase NimA-like FMN-containing flavoprotein (pyridoxamine 5'-phosphate oxidase superfamily)
VPLLRLVTLGPRLALGLAERLTPSAIGNARAAAQSVSQSVADRRRLDPDVAGDEPGSLSRIPREECVALLASRQVGRLAYVARPGVPDVVPVNFTLHGDDVLVRSGAGPKLQAAERGEVLVLQVDDVDEDAHAGWSVVAAGPALRLSIAQQRALPAGVLPETWATGPRHAVIRIRTDRVEGRRLR